MAFLEERKKAKKTRVETAKALGVSIQTVYYWEVGTWKPTVDNLEKLAEFYGCTTDALLGRDDSGRDR